MNDEVTEATEADLPRIFEVWEASVRATHTFLTEADIQFLIPLVKEGLAHFSPIHCLRDDDHQVIAFLGVADSKIEMLFVHPGHRGAGAGKALTHYAVEVLGARLVDVNEQNEQAVGFYEHLGFRRVSRSALDPTGKPFPILHMELRRPFQGLSNASTR
jgi:putative acetyltransferase